MVVELPPGYQPSADEEFMNPKQVEYFRRRFEQSRADLRGELDAIPPPEAQDITQEGDQTDHASAASEREFALQNRERIQRLMRQTERALSKLEDGTYGYCEDTGEPIDLKRLMAQPTTSLSLAAQQARRSNRLTSLHGRAARVCFPRPAYCDARLGPTSVAPPSTTRT
jgi:DnaK suppressor protein